METILITIVSLVVIIALAFYMIKVRDKIANGDLKFVEIMNDKAVIVTTIIHSGGEGDAFYHTKLTIYDLKNPRERKIKIFKQELKEIHRVENYLVLELERRYFSIFDTETFEECFNTRQPENYLKLDSEDGIAEMKYQKGDWKFDITTRQGKKLYVYLKDILKLKNTEPQTEKRKYPIGNFNLYKHKQNETFVLHYNHQPIPEGKEYINAQVVSGDENIGVVLHDSSIMEYPEVSVTGVNSKGQEVWTYNQQQLKLKHEREYDNRIKLYDWREEGEYLLLAFKAKKDRVVGLNKKSGNIMFLY